jgi:GGDEF domain-containing protein
MRGKSGGMERGVPRRRRPRPVASEGIEALSLRGEELAKGWLLALVEDAPLESTAAILAGDVARDGPRICESVVRAIYDEADLRRIEAGAVLEPLVSRVGELAGVRTAESAAHAVDALRSVIWSALRTELAHTDPDVLADAAERLSLVAELVRAAVLRRREETVAGDERGGAHRAHRAHVAPLRVAQTDVPAASREVPPPAGPHERRGERGVTPGHEGTGATARAHAAEHGGFENGGATGHGPARDIGDALWIGALRDEIVRAARARVPLSLLLVELEEAERLLAAEPPASASATFGRFAQAVRTALRHRDVLACETESRAWIIARDTGRAGAQALGSRIATAVPTEESWRGAPLTVSVGLAVLGEDGHNAASLIDAAEQMRFAAEASGIGILTEPGDGGSEPPAPDPPPAG